MYLSLLKPNLEIAFVAYLDIGVVAADNDIAVVVVASATADIVVDFETASVAAVDDTARLLHVWILRLLLLEITMTN